MPRKVMLNVLLPKNRNHTGWIRVEVDGIPQAEFPVLGRGSHIETDKKTGVPIELNKNRGVFEHAGDTPTGDYIGTAVESTAGQNQSSYGPWGKIRLKAVGGDALLAEDIFKRNNLLIHGGSQGQFDGYKATHGCLRLHNGDMRQLIQLLSDTGNNSQALMCEQASVSLSVREW